MTAYDVITARIVALLEAGTVPWRKPWRSSGELPTNLRSQRPYRGINVFMLLCAPHASRYWLTFKQARELGGQVRKGEHGYPVVFWQWLDRRGPAAESEGDDDAPRRGRAPLVKYYTVFNVEQCDGLPAPVDTTPAAPFVPLDLCEQTVLGMPDPPTIQHHGATAYYRPSEDTITLPPREAFLSPEEYYQTCFHEMCHASGHAKRLARKGVTAPTRFAGHEYSREELIAEMGAAFLAGHCGISPATVDNSAAYLASWLQVLRGDSKLVVQAAASAQKAADHILGPQAGGAADAEAA